MGEDDNIFNMVIYHLCIHETLATTICSFKTVFENTFFLVSPFVATWNYQTEEIHELYKGKGSLMWLLPYSPGVSLSYGHTRSGIILSLILKAGLTGCKHSHPHISSANNAGSKKIARFPVSSLFKIHFAQHSSRHHREVKARRNRTQILGDGAVYCGI